MSRTAELARSHRPKYGVLLYVLAGIAALIVLAWIAIAIIVARAAPTLKERVIRDISERFNGTAELGALHVSVFPQLRVVGQDLVLRLKGETGPPFISVRHFDLHANPLDLLRWPLSVGTVHVTGLSITVPPHGDRPKMEANGSAPSKSSFVIGKLVCDDANLEILTDKPGKFPLIFEIEHLVLDSAGPGRAMPFTAHLTNPKPVGSIAAKGKFGPWENQEPRDTPVSGTYSFTNADLATINGIGGILKSTGEFKGVLGKIEVQGKTDTPDFTVSTGQHPMALHTEFSATVDGTDGNTYLHPVRATLGQSVLVANGSVVRQEGGHVITLDVVSSGARIEDLLRVAVKTNPPALSGPVTLNTKLLLPADGAPVPERLNLDGAFSLPAAHFSAPGAQDKLDELSLRAQGRAKEAQNVGKDTKAGDEVPPSDEVLSQMHGTFKLKSGVVTIPDLKFSVPGASISMSGAYQLLSQDFSFEGEARLEAKLSQLTTGVKSFFLKALDPLFDKQGAGTVLPLRISGTGTSPKIGLDFGHAKRAK